MADRVGQQLGNYQLIRLLGEGGFAEVYLGEHIYLKTQAAIKILQMRLASEDREGFLKEARTIAGLKHPHIIRVFDFGIDAGTPFLVMDYAPHGILRQRHPKGIPLALSTIVNYVKQVAPALQYAHERKLVHRDVKPENVLLGEDHEALLSDFGIALVTQSSRYQSTQEVAGTAAYMAPEQLQGKPRLASDQYALGITVYEWVCGDRPFHGTFTELYSQHLFVRPPPLREKVPTIPPAVEQVVLTALEKDPLKRFASVQAFATALEQASQVKRPEPEPEPVVPVLETTGTHQSQQLTEMATPPPVRPFSQQALSEVLADTPAQPQMMLPLSGKVARSSKSPALRPDAMVAVKPVKPGTSRRFVLLMLAGLVIVALASGIAWFTVYHASPTGGIHASPAGSITEFPIPTAKSGPFVITAGPDGNLWFTEKTGNKIGRISPSGTITEFPVPTAQSYPFWIAVGPDGNLWFTEFFGNKIGRITPSGTITEFPVPTVPDVFAVGPDGNLWFTESTVKKIGRITPSGTITEFPLPTASSSPWVIVAGPDGNLWFTEYLVNGNKIGRISPSGTITEFPVPTAQSFPSGITAGPDGNLWFTEGDGNKIGRITSGK